jgi:hypothetical protein
MLREFIDRIVLGAFARSGIEGPPLAVQRLDLKPGDKVVIMFEQPFSPVQIGRLNEMWRREFPDTTAFILENGAKLAVLGKAAGLR